MMKGTYDVMSHFKEQIYRKQYIRTETQDLLESKFLFATHKSLAPKSELFLSFAKTAKYDCSCTFQHLRMPFRILCLFGTLLLTTYVVSCFKPSGIDVNLNFFSNVLGVLDKLPICEV